jgi:choline kinase
MDLTEICRQLQWDGVVVEPLQSGTSNTLYKIRSGHNVALLRVYGLSSTTLYDPAYEQATFQLLGKAGLAPRTLAQGEGWRVEEFILGCPLRQDQLPSSLADIAVQLARLHKVQFAPRPPVALDRLQTWGAVAPHLQPELDAMKSVLSTKQHFLYDVVFSHNDVQENNMMSSENGLRLIDFEYADFNYRGADIGNLFNEFCYDYTVAVLPCFSETSAYPTLEAQRWFAAVYLSEWWGTPVNESSHAREITDFLSEVHVFSQLSHLLWGLWSLIRADHSAIPFDFRKYADVRFAAYFRNRT